MKCGRSNAFTIGVVSGAGVESRATSSNVSLETPVERSEPTTSRFQAAQR